MQTIKWTVVSDSMLPLIEIGKDLAIEKKSEFAKFDIVLFKRSDKFIVHYIWRNQISYNQTVITRSLKEIYADEEPVHISEILGTVKNFRIGPLMRIKIKFLTFISGND